MLHKVVYRVDQGRLFGGLVNHEVGHGPRLRSAAQIAWLANGRRDLKVDVIVFIIYRRRELESHDNLWSTDFFWLGSPLVERWAGCAKQSLAGQLIRAEERLRANEASAAGNEQRIRAEVENIALKIGEENSARFIELAHAKLENQQQEATHEWTCELEVANLVNRSKTKWPNSPP